MEVAEKRNAALCGVRHWSINTWGAAQFECQIRVEESGPAV